MVYYQKAQRVYNSLLENKIIAIFKKSRNTYGTRRLKEALLRINLNASRKKIKQIMLKYSLVSCYTVKKMKNVKKYINNEQISNIVNRDFNKRNILEVVVSDLTYVNVMGKWHYLCVLVDLFNREIIGHSVGSSKNADLVKQAFLSTKVNLSKISIFHTDRGSEFKNKTIDDVINTFCIKRSLSKPGSPYDNAVAEASYKTIKTEFVAKRIFHSLNQLKMEFTDYVNWYNKQRLHSSLGYMTPIEFKYHMTE